MPVFSYLAYPHKGQKQDLIKDLTALPHCDVLAADKAEVVILVTETPDETAEKTLQKKLEQLDSLQSLGMTFGHVG